MKRQTPSRLLLTAALLMPPAAQAATVLAELASARDVICSFDKSGPVRVPRPLQRVDDDLMLIVEGIGLDTGTASVTSSRGIGARPARVYATNTGVHIVEDVNDSVIVTTVLACEAWNSDREPARCRRFSAVIAWHFDRSVHVNPDRSFLALPGSSYSGHCEPWSLD